MRQKRRYPADRARLSLDVEKGKVAFGCRVEFEDPRNREALREPLPDVGTQSIADRET